MASGVDASQGVSWSVNRTSGNLGLSVSESTQLDAFQTDGNSFLLTATGTERGTVEITGTTGGSTRSVIWAVFTQPDHINTPPVFANLSNHVVSEGEMVSFSVVASDVDGDALEIEAETLPKGAGFTDGVFEWTPGFDQAGNHEVRFSVDDGQEKIEQTVHIQVNQVDRPVIVQAYSPSRAGRAGRGGSGA